MLFQLMSNVGTSARNLIREASIIGVHNIGAVEFE